MPIEGLTLVGAMALGAPVAKVRFDPVRRRLFALMAGTTEVRGLRYSEDHDLEEQYRIDAGPAPLADVAYAPGYDWFITVGAGRKAELWDPGESRRKAQRTLPQANGTSVAFVRKAKVLLLGGARGVAGVDSYEGRPWGDVRTSGPVVAMAVHPEDRVALCVAAVGARSHVFFGRAILVEKVPGVVQHDVCYRPGFAVLGAAFSPDGRSFALVGGTDGVLELEVVAFPAMRTRLRWRLAAPVDARVLAESVGFDDTGTRVWLGTPSGKILDVQVSSGAVQGDVDAHEGPVASMDVRHGRRLVVTAGVDGAVKLWKMPDLVRRHDPDAPKLPVTDELKGWFPLWERKDLEGMRTFDPPEGMVVIDS